MSFTNLQPSSVNTAATFTFANVSVTNKSTLGAVGNVKITGGSSGQVISTDGTGNLSFTSVTATTASTVTANAQPNITSVGTLINLTSGLITATSGGIKVGNIQDTAGTNTISLASGNVSMIGNLNVGTAGAGNVTATYFIGNGSQLTNVVATTAGTVTTAAQPNITSVGTLSGLTVGGTGFTTLQQSTEVLLAPTFANPLTVSLQSGTTVYVTPTANFTLNATNVPTTDNRTIVVVVILAQGTTGYYPNVFQIDSVGQTINWPGGTAPTANANKKDVASFTLIRTGAAWTVLGQYGTFG